MEPDTDTDDPDRATIKQASSDEDDNAVASDYEEHSEKELSSESAPDDSASEEETKPSKTTPRGRSAKSTALPSHMKNGDDLWKAGAKLAPGTQVIIKKPKARDAGDTPYKDSTIHPNTM